MLEHGRHRVDALAGVDESRREHLLTAECEQLPRESGRALAGLLDLVELEPDVASFVDTLEREAGESEDGGQQVVEVVRDAAGEPADRFHLLRLLELPLDGLPRLALFARLPPQLGVAELPVDGRRQPREVVLENVVVRAGAHRLDRGVLADGAGDDDEGALELARLDGCQRVGAN